MAAVTICSDFGAQKNNIHQYKIKSLKNLLIGKHEASYMFENLMELSTSQLTFSITNFVTVHGVTKCQTQPK